MFRRRRRPWDEFTVLATFNSEVARGIVHTEDWRQRMEAEQARFDAARDEWNRNLPYGFDGSGGMMP